MGKYDPTEESTPTTGQWAKVDQRQIRLGSTRNKPLHPDIVKAISYAAGKVGMDVEVFSGGQTDDRRIGNETHNHDVYKDANGEGGGAADLRLYPPTDGERQYVNYMDDEGQKIYAIFIEEARAAGMNGIGIGHGYMSDDSIHVGRRNVWRGGEMIIDPADKDAQEGTWGAPSMPERAREAFARGSKRAKDFQYP